MSATATDAITPLVAPPHQSVADPEPCLTKLDELFPSRPYLYSKRGKTQMSLLDIVQVRGFLPTLLP